MALTDTEIRRSKPVDAPYKLSDAHGLYLLVKPNGGRLWRWKYRVEGKEKLMALGTYPELSLADARERHAKARKQLANGIDPMAERMADKTAVMVAIEHTFEKIAELWLTHWKGNKSARHSEHNPEPPQGNVYPVLADRPIAGSGADGACQARQEHRSARSFRYGEAHSPDCRHGFPLRRRPRLQQAQSCREIRPSDILKPTRKTNMARIDAKELPALLRAIEVYEGTSRSPGWQ